MSQSPIRSGRTGKRAGALALALVLLSAPAAVAAEAPASRNPDPWEKVNRGLFWFNEQFDIYLVLPVAKGWRFITPWFVRKGIENFNNNLTMPVDLSNDLMQLKPGQAGFDVLRMAYNSTLGLAGFIDIATMIEIPESEADFDQTLGYWGVPTGPYFVLPIFGPSSVRGAVGRLGDAAATFYFSFLPEIYITFIVRSVELVNLRSRYIEEIDENRRESFDYYVFLRDAYLQNRRAKVARARGEEEAAGDEDIYFFDDEEDDDEGELDELDELDEPGEAGETDAAQDGWPEEGGGDADAAP